MDLNLSSDASCSQKSIDSNVHGAGGLRIEIEIVSWVVEMGIPLQGVDSEDAESGLHRLQCNIRKSECLVRLTCKKSELRC